MQQLGNGRFNAELKAMVVEASLALARLDAERLEELALSCRALNRDLSARSGQERLEMAREGLELTGEMAVFERVLEATRANLDVMSRVRELRAGQREYGSSVRLRSSARREWVRTGDGDGNH
ncbi:MAG TPA: hypothetical protein VGG62_11800 [Terracidiphilus sp.]|jgi:hypothetical protein